MKINSCKKMPFFPISVAPELMTVKIPNRSSKHWNMETGYESNVSEHEILYPYRVFGCGSRDTLTILMGITLDESQRYCRELAPGFRILFHNPGILLLFFFVPLHCEIIYLPLKIKKNP